MGISWGQTNHQIAASLYVSPFTVKTHLQRVYRKLGVGGRTEALARALESVKPRHSRRYTYPLPECSARKDAGAPRVGGP